ncbi:glycosyltransferase family 4 protein [Ramlibacter sp. MMS24-I3-19]|uniref:glycosyltransferase family 4 protein n=1 Tax=Ramlibacter sp. MMS24-I3-19 TaxID=3416606 RepID=UPI003D05F889
MDVQVQAVADADTSADVDALAGKKVLIIVENLPVPFDRRVWQEAQTLRDAGATVAVICPTGKGFDAREEVIQGIHIYRHPLPLDASSARGYLVEYGAALYWEFRLALRVWRRHGIDVIHACNPPDLIFLVAAPFKLFGKRFIFDHHDINPELYEAKFGKRDFFWRLMCLLERLTFKLADVSIATNNSYRGIALQRGGMAPDRVFVVRSGPNLAKLRRSPPNGELRRGRRYLVGYVGVMGSQEGIDLLLASIEYLVKEKKRTDIQFCLVGGGPALEQMRALAVEKSIEEFVHFTGRVPDDQLFEVLSTADVCVNPDRVNAMNDKSTMNKILEYMAFGCPIVQFDVTEGRFSAGDASAYAKPNDVHDMAEKIVELLDNLNQRKAMALADARA